jgi:VCBS repeat-containing protein
LSDGTVSDSQSITVTVNAVNDAPIAQSDSVEILEDESIIIQLSGIDVDGDVLTFSLETNGLYGSVSLDGNLATYAPQENVNGTDSFEFIVSDGEYSSTASISIVIQAVNDIPVITSIAGTLATEDIEYTYQVTVTDPDNDSFDFILDDAPDGMSISDTGLITWTALEGILTSGLVTLIVNDGELFSVELFIITVAAVNDVSASDVTTGTSLTAATVIMNNSTENNSPSFTINVTNPDVKIPSSAVHVIKPVSEMLIPSGASSRIKSKLSLSGSVTVT